MNNFSAMYMPSSDRYESRGGFDTKEEAEKYILDNMCKDCQECRQRILAGETTNDDEDFVSEFPPCFWEWIIVPSSVFDNKDDVSYGELMDAAGWKTVYSKT